MDELFLPVLSHFENGNFWTASGGRMRYRVDPEPGEEPQLAARVWEGPWSLADSPVEEEARFPLSEAGLEELRAWAVKWRAQIDARPKKTLAETVAARDAFRAAKAAEE